MSAVQSGRRKSRPNLLDFNLKQLTILNQAVNLRWDIVTHNQMNPAAAMPDVTYRRQIRELRTILRKIAAIKKARRAIIS